MRPKKIGIIGTGKFGKLLVEILPEIFPESSILSISRNSENYFEQVRQSDLIIPAVPIHAFEQVIRGIAHEIHPHAVLMDVCSVKVFPVRIMKKYVASTNQIIAAHPMFGPGTIEKVQGNCNGLRIVMEHVRGSGEVYTYLKNQFQNAGFEIIEMTAEDHDKYAAKFHFTAHFFASVIEKIHLQRSPIDTKSAESLFDFAEMVQADSQSLLREMYRFNPYCKSQLKKIITSYQDIITFIQNA